MIASFAKYRLVRNRVVSGLFGTGPTGTPSRVRLTSWRKTK